MLKEKKEIRKVKVVSPSPFYDGKYHPPKMSSMTAAIFIMSPS
jgi:hypothetical protein